MCLPISAKVTNIHGEILGRVERLGLNDISLRGRHDQSRFPRLWGIDPVGDTPFDRLQVEMLREELDVLRPDLDGSLLPVVDELQGLIRIVLEGVHRTMTFVGD